MEEYRALGHQDVLCECFVIGSGIDAFLVVTLIKYEALEYAFAVDHEAFIVKLNLSHAEIGGDGIRGVAVADLDFEIVECRSLDGPEGKLAQCNGGLQGFQRGFCFGRADYLAAEACRDRDVFHADCGEGQFKIQFFVVHVGIHADIFEINGRHDFHPDGSENTRGAGVIATVGLITCALLTGGLGSVACNVGFAINGDGVISVCQVLRNIEGEGRVAAAVATDGFTVNENLRFVADRFKVQNDAVLITVGDVNGLAIPAGRDKVLVADAGKLAFGTKRNLNRFFKMFLARDTARFSRFTEVEFKFPFSAEVDPAFADKLGTGISVSCSHEERSFQILFVAFMVSQKCFYVNEKINFLGFLVYFIHKNMVIQKMRYLHSV